jgi:hypothetical protein
MATRSKSKAAPVEEIDDDEVELDEIDEVEDDDEDEAPAKKTKAKAKAAPKEDDVWGVRALIEHVKETTGKEYNPREVRTLLRKLAREGGGVDREIIPGNKSRYEWTGPTDPEVKAIIKAIKGGQIEKSKKEALDKLKADKAKKTAAKQKAAAKAQAAAEAEDDDEDDDD